MVEYPVVGVKVIYLYLVFVPSPQVTLHSPQEVQSDQPQGAAIDSNSLGWLANSDLIRSITNPTRS